MLLLLSQTYFHYPFFLSSVFAFMFSLIYTTEASRIHLMYFIKKAFINLWNVIKKMNAFGEQIQKVILAGRQSMDVKCD